jgi:hypothetical protein
MSFILVQQDFVPGFNVIMVTVELLVVKTFEGIRGHSPVFLGNESNDEERMESDSSWNSLAFDRVDLYGLSFKEYISIKLNGLI